MDKTVVEIVAIAVGPLLAVLITVRLQRGHQTYDGERHLFFALMANRRFYPIAREWVEAEKSYRCCICKTEENNGTMDSLA